MEPRTRRSHSSKDLLAVDLPVTSKAAGLPPFLSKTWEMLSCPAYSKFIVWSAAGDHIVIRHVESFSVEVLPKFFKTANFSSFVRQLHIYGFRKIGDDGAGQQSFAHQMFVREASLEGLKSIQRKNIKPHSQPDIDASPLHNSGVNDHVVTLGEEDGDGEAVDYAEDALDGPDGYDHIHMQGAVGLAHAGPGIHVLAPPASAKPSTGRKGATSARTGASNSGFEEGKGVAGTKRKRPVDLGELCRVVPIPPVADAAAFVRDTGMYDSPVRSDNDALLEAAGEAGKPRARSRSTRAQSLAATIPDTTKSPTAGPGAAVHAPYTADRIIHELKGLHRRQKEIVQRISTSESKNERLSRDVTVLFTEVLRLQDQQNTVAAILQSSLSDFIGTKKPGRTRTKRGGRASSTKREKRSRATSSKQAAAGQSSIIHTAIPRPSPLSVAAAVTVSAASPQPAVAAQAIPDH